MCLGATVYGVPGIPTGGPGDVGIHIDHRHNQVIHGVRNHHIVANGHQCRNNNGGKTDPCRMPTKMLNINIIPEYVGVYTI